MCSPSPPPAPDFNAAAIAQGAANRETALTQGHINNPNVVNPFGRQTVTWDGEQPTITQDLSPDQQALLDQRNQTQLRLGGLAQQGAGSLEGLIGSQVDFSGLPQRPTALGYPRPPNAVPFHGSPGVNGNPAARGPGLPPIHGGPGGAPQNGNPASRGPFFHSPGNGPPPPGGNPALGGPGLHSFGQGTPGGSTNPAARGVSNFSLAPPNPVLKSNGDDNFGDPGNMGGTGGFNPTDPSTDSPYGDIPIPQVQNTPNALNSNFLPQMEGPLDSNGLPYVGTADQVRQNVIDAMMGRTNTDIGKRQDQMNSDLIARGIRPGTEAYSREQDMIERARNDARQQAEIAGGNAAQQMFGMDLSRRQQATGEQGQTFQQATSNRGMSAAEQAQAFQQELAGGAQRFGQQGQVSQLLQQLQGQGFGQQSQNRRDAIAELLAQRQTPLNEISTLMGGSGVSNPFTAPGFAQNGSIAPPPIFGAATAQNAHNLDVFNAQQGGSNATTGALGSAAAAAAMYFF